MFRKRVKKEYPAGTFIATPARVMAILQLCVVFTILCWQMSKPFMADLYQTKSKMAVFDFVLKDQERFSSLPEAKKQEILTHYEKLKEQLATPFVSKLMGSFLSLSQFSPTFLIWLILGTVLPILLLKKVDGARPLIWLMVFVALAYCFENRFFEPALSATREELLFPSEALIVKDHMSEPLSNDPFTQHEQLKRGWDHYLDQVWGKGKGSAEGLFAFNVERAVALATEPPVSRGQQPLLLLAFFLFWNLSFAFVVKESLKKVG